MVTSGKRSAKLTRNVYILIIFFFLDKTFLEDGRIDTNLSWTTKSCTKADSENPKESKFLKKLWYSVGGVGIRNLSTKFMMHANRPS